MVGRVPVRRSHAGGVLALLVVAAVLYVAPPASALDCEVWADLGGGTVSRGLVVEPVDGQFPGLDVVVSGAAFDPGRNVWIWFESEALLEAGYDEPFAQTVTDSNGAFTITQAIPGDFPIGVHTLHVQDGHADCQIEYEVVSVVTTDATVATSPGFDVEPAVCVPPMSAEPTSGEPGAEIAVSGIGFEPGTRIDVYFDDIFLATVDELDVTGAWSLTAEVPDRSPGSYPLRYVAEPSGGGGPYFCDQPEFTVLAAPDPGTETQPTATTAAAPASTSTTTQTPPTTQAPPTTLGGSDPEASTQSLPATEDGGGIPLWLIGALIGMGAGVVGAGGWLLGQRREAGPPPPPPPPPPAI